MSVNWALPFDEKLSPKIKRNLIAIRDYHRTHSSTVRNYRKFWGGVAGELPWYRHWSKVVDDSNPPFFKWFPGGRLNACYLCVDRHANSWRRNKVALIWEGEPLENGKPKEVRKLTYGDLYGEVNRQLTR